MRVEDMIFISVDDHLVEPPHLFEGRMPAKFADRAPRVEHTDAGDDVWIFDGQTIPNIGLNAVAGRPKEEYGVNPTAFDEMRPGCYDVHERVKDMSAGGVLACMCFPSFPVVLGPAVPRQRRQGPRARVGAGLQRLAHRRVVRHAIPAASSRWRSRCCGTRSCARPRSGASRRRAATRSPSPRTRTRSGCRASTTRTGTRCGARSWRRERSSTSTSARRASSRSPRPTRRST